MSKSAKGSQTYIIEREKDGQKEVIEESFYSNKKDASNHHKGLGYKIVSITKKV